jgi:hypothetical protein
MIMAIRNYLVSRHMFSITPIASQVVHQCDQVGVRTDTSAVGLGHGAGLAHYN